MNKRYLIVLLIGLAAIINCKAESALPSQIILTPYIEHDASTPSADKVLLDKLNRIITNYGVGSNSGMQTPFIITAHADDLKRETTATVPPNTVVELSLTLYIGNGEEGTLFSTCNMTLKGVGSSVDKAYASAFKRLDVNDPGIKQAIETAQSRIAQYYASQGPSLINKARQLAAAADYSAAYATLLRIPAICPQYDEAQRLVLEIVNQEADNQNRQIISRAKAAWSANPTEAGAAEARDILSGVSNASPAVRSEFDQLTKEISSRLQSVADAEQAAIRQSEAYSHAERMAEIDKAKKVAVAQAKNQPKYIYSIHWW